MIINYYISIIYMNLALQVLNHLLEVFIPYIRLFIYIMGKRIHVYHSSQRCYFWCGWPWKHINQHICAILLVLNKYMIWNCCKIPSTCNNWFVVTYYGRAGTITTGDLCGKLSPFPSEGVSTSWQLVLGPRSP